MSPLDNLSGERALLPRGLEGGAMACRLGARGVGGRGGSARPRGGAGRRERGDLRTLYRAASLALGDDMKNKAVFAAFKERLSEEAAGKKPSDGHLELTAARLGWLLLRSERTGRLAEVVEEILSRKDPLPDHIRWLWEFLDLSGGPGGFEEWWRTHGPDVRFDPRSRRYVNDG